MESQIQQTDKDIKKAIVESAQADISLLVAAKESAKLRVIDDPSKQNLDAFDKASKMLSDILDADKEPSFANRIEALRWLNRQGYKIKKSKLYNDCKVGLLKLQADGSVLEGELKKYIRRAGLEKLAETTIVNPADTKKERDKEELQKLRTQNRLLKHQLDEKHRKYILRADFEMEFAAKISVFKSGIEHMVYSYGFEWTKIVQDSDPASASQRLIAGIISVMKKQFNDFANIKNFEVVFAQEEISAQISAEE